MADQSDALVFFGATGDPAYKQLFPALASLVAKGKLDIPIIGVAKQGWDLDQLKQRAHDSLAEQGPVDEALFAKLTGLNMVGMKRRNFGRERLTAIRSFYQNLFHGPGLFAERLNTARDFANTDPAIAEILNFIDAGKHRELCQPVKHGNRS